MASKKIGVAYVPTSSDIPALAPQKIEEPSYPDVGTAYAGYSKALMSGNQFKLNPQTPVDWNITNTWGAGSTGGSFTGPSGVLQDGKDFYVTKIIIGNYNGGAVANIDTITLSSGSSAKLVLRELQPSLTGNFLLDLDFLTPIKFDKGQGIGITYSNARAAGDFLVLNMYGWAE